MTNDEFEKRLISAIERTVQNSVSDLGNDKPVPLQQAFDECFETMKGYIDRSFDDIQTELNHLGERIASVEMKTGKPVS